MESKYLISSLERDEKKSSRWEKLLGHVTIAWIFKLLLLAILFVFVFGMIAFFWEREKFEFDYPIDASIWGSFGEWIGGVLGTMIAVFSIYLLIKTLNFQIETLKSQIKSNEKINANNNRNTEIYILQQFHDTFNTLVSLYQNSIEDFKTDNNIKGKKFFHEQVKELQNSFTASNGDYEKEVQLAVNKFYEFYTKYREYASVYFRLLYRVFQHIDSFKISEDEISENKKIEYAKIVRCQLSEDEMFLLRYNAMTTSGENMKRFINRYNLLKHFPIMSLLEFNRWRSKITEIEKNSLDSLFVDFRKQMKGALQSLGEKTFEHKTNDYKYLIKSEVAKNNTSAKFEIIKNNNISVSKDTISLALDKFDDDEIKELIDAFIQEVFIFSNFSIYTSLSNTDIKKDIYKVVVKKQDTFWVTIERKGNYPLILSQRQIDTPRKTT
jgi:hypothetical protein